MSFEFISRILNFFIVPDSFYFVSFRRPQLTRGDASTIKEQERCKFAKQLE